MEREECWIHRGSPIISILSRINPILRIDTYFIKIHSNIVYHLHLGLSRDLFPVVLTLKVLKTLLASSTSTKCSAHPVDVITLTKETKTTQTDHKTKKEKKNRKNAMRW